MRIADGGLTGKDSLGETGLLFNPPSAIRIPQWKTAWYTLPRISSKEREPPRVVLQVQR
jgi:hypothetical protein